MTKVVGLKVLSGISKKSGKQLDAVVFHCVKDTPRDKEFIGHEVSDQYVAGELARTAAKEYGGVYLELVGKAVRFQYSKGGYLEDLTVE